MNLKRSELAKLIGVTVRTIHLRESDKTPIKSEAELAIRSIADGYGKPMWLAISDDCIPPMEVPVWLYMPEVRQPIIGCRTEYDGAWFWSRCYDDFWLENGQWKTTTAEMEDMKPTHWMPLPQLP
jgi:transcriptional regulator with XRE-family HTH domain